MSSFLQNIYVYLWAALAVMMIVISIKRRKTLGAIPIVLALYFVFMTVWYGLRTFGGYAMFEGTLGTVFRVILVVFLIILVAVYLIDRNKNKK